MAEIDDRRLRDLVYATFAREGRAPSKGELARLADTTIDAVQESLTRLADAHALVLVSDGDAIRMAHPFSAAPMGFVVTPVEGADQRCWWGGCAWDSFGISAALGIDVTIDTTCPHCHTHLHYTAGPQTPPPETLAVRFPTPADQWWGNVVATCTAIRTFCTREHAQLWSQAHTPGEGHVAEATTVWALARDWYGDRLDADFTPHTREHNQQLLDTHGLTGPFWKLP